MYPSRAQALCICHFTRITEHDTTRSRHSNMKFIIYNESTLPDAEAMAYVQAVIKEGLVSKNEASYCYVTVFAEIGYEIHVYADRISKTTHRFEVHMVKREA